MRTYYVYIMASRSRVLYTGVTNDLTRRVNEHKRGLTDGFTTKYRITRLVYFEEFADVRDAIAREKEVKGWKRSRKITLVEGRNPTWEDLARDWFQMRTPQTGRLSFSFVFLVKNPATCHPEWSARNARVAKDLLRERAERARREGTATEEADPSRLRRSG